MGFSWDWRQKCSALSYLCPDDMLKLKEEVRGATESGFDLDTIDVLDEAGKIKSERLIHDMVFFEHIFSPELKQRLAEKSIESLSRSWINMELSYLEGTIRNRGLIDPKRLEACNYQTINTYFFHLVP